MSSPQSAATPDPAAPDQPAADRSGPDQPAPDKPAGPGPDGNLEQTVVALTADDIEPAHRRHLVGRLVALARQRGVRPLFRPKSALRWMTDLVADVAPYIPLRDLETLRRHHDGLDGDALAQRLVRNAARATAGVGAAGGGVAAVEWAVTPTLLSAPVLLAAETVAVVAIELKLVGELHEVFRADLPDGSSDKAVALIRSWATQRGVNPLMPGAGMGAVLGTAARTELRDSLLRRFGRNLTTLGPLLTGAAVAGYLNRRATLSLGERLREDLRRRGRPAAQPPAPPAGGS